LVALAGWCSSRVLNDCDVITSRSTSEAVVTVAVRGVCAISAISPKKSPGPSWFTRRSPLRTSTLPSTRTKNSRPIAPSRISSLPGPKSISSASFATSASSFREQRAKSGTPLISSIFALRPSAIEGESTASARRVQSDGRPRP
jgi:hypothetical protein